MNPNELIEAQKARRIIAACRKALKGMTFGRFIRELKKRGISPK